MKLDFFHDKAEGKPYQSFEDWCQEIKHLILPLLIMIMLIVIILSIENF